MTAPLTYIFIFSAVGHLVLLYLHHASAPHVNMRISLGIEKAKIFAEGLRQAEQELDLSRAEMGGVIRASLVAEVRRDLNMAPLVIDAKALPVPAQEAPTRSKPLQLTGGIGALREKFLSAWNARKQKPDSASKAAIEPEQRPSAAADGGAISSPEPAVEPEQKLLLTPGGEPAPLVGNNGNGHKH